MSTRRWARRARRGPGCACSGSSAPLPTRWRAASILRGGTPRRGARCDRRPFVHHTSQGGRTSTGDRLGPGRVLEQRRDPVDRGVLPVDLTAVRHLEVGGIERPGRSERVWTGMTTRRRRCARWSRAPWRRLCRGRHLADRSFHAHLDELVEFEGVLHGQLPGDRLDEAAHDHRHRLVLRHAAATAGRTAAPR